MFRKKKAAAAAAKARRRKRRADESGDSDSSEDANGVFNGGNHSVTTAKSDATTGILGSDLVAAVCRSEIKGNVKSDMTGNTTSRRSENDNGNKEGGDGSLQYTTPTTLERILRAKKRRKLLSSLHSRRGVDAASLLTAVAVSAGDPGEANSSFSIPESNLGSESSGLRQRLEGAFGTGSGADGEEEGVLKAKHRDAMETYIRERTGHKKGGVDAGKGVGGNYSTGGAEKLEREAEEAEAEEVLEPLPADVPPVRLLCSAGVWLLPLPGLLPRPCPPPLETAVVAVPLPLPFRCQSSHCPAAAS